MELPLISGLLGGKKEPSQEQIINPNRIAQNIPLIQPTGQLPSVEVVREVTATEYIPEEWKKKYRAFDLKTIAYSNLNNKKEALNLKLQFEVCQSALNTLKVKDDLLIDIKDEDILGLYQDSTIIYLQGLKAVNSNLLNKVLSSTSISKTEVATGTIKKEEKPSLTNLFFR